MAAGTGSAEDEELGLGGPLSFLDVASVFAVGVLEIFGCDHAVLAVTDFDSIVLADDVNSDSVPTPPTRK